MKRSRDIEYIQVQDESSQKKHDITDIDRKELFRLPYVSLNSSPCNDIELPHIIKIGDIFLHEETVLVLIEYDHISRRT